MACIGCSYYKFPLGNFSEVKIPERQGTGYPKVYEEICKYLDYHAEYIDYCVHSEYRVSYKWSYPLWMRPMLVRKHDLFKDITTFSYITSNTAKYWNASKQIKDFQKAAETYIYMRTEGYSLWQIKWEKILKEIVEALT